jgi:hypothetical protein
MDLVGDILCLAINLMLDFLSFCIRLQGYEVLSQIIRDSIDKQRYDIHDIIRMPYFKRSSFI